MTAIFDRLFRVLLPFSIIIAFLFALVPSLNEGSLYLVGYIFIEPARLASIVISIYYDSILGMTFLDPSCPRIIDYFIFDIYLISVACIYACILSLIIASIKTLLAKIMWAHPTKAYFF